MDIRKIFHLSFIPLLIVTAILIVSEFVALPFYSVKGASTCVRLPGIILTLVCLAWAGHKVGKEGMDSNAGIVAGVLTVVISHGVWILLHAMFMLVFRIDLPSPNTYSGELTSFETLANTMGYAMAGLCICPSGWVLIGAVMGAIGHKISQKK